MGYYSNLAIEGTYHEDHSYPSPELQLKWRIEDLRSRLEDTELPHIALWVVGSPEITWWRTLRPNTFPENPI